MAISGCDFICNTETCKYKGHGVVLTDAWPLGDIDKVIASRSIDFKNVEFRKELTKLKEQEKRAYACITLPNVDKIPTVGYRIHMWCQKCPRIWNYDAIIPENEETEVEKIIELSVKSANIPETCPICGDKLKTYAECVKEDGDGINCIECKNKLTPNVWFCNEVKI
jgi:hypothetical protein